METNRFVLCIRMVMKFGLGLFIMGAILFFSAGSIGYLNGWILMIALSVPMAVFGFFLLIKNPAALGRRLQSKEPDKKQRAVIGFTGAIFITTFVLSGLNYRFLWPGAPFPVTVAAIFVMLAGYGMFVVVIMQNTYASRIVEVQENQKIITTGLYSLIRHPMYTASIIIFISMPFVLGSWIAAIPMLFYSVIITHRIKNEEALLLRELDGYSEYVSKVKYRLLPLVW